MRGAMQSLDLSKKLMRRLASFLECSMGNGDTPAGALADGNRVIADNLRVERVVEASDPVLRQCLRADNRSYNTARRRAVAISIPPAHDRNCDHLS